ncbi:MAG: hypothetical protein ACREQY_08095, partial [Candidatus Binatia bacterium]
MTRSRLSLSLRLLGSALLANGALMLFLPHAWFHEIIPGVPETGPYNPHLVQDIGNFYIAIGLGLLVAAGNPRRHSLAIAIGAGALVLHSLLHFYGSLTGMLPLRYLPSEIVTIHVPAVLLVGLAAL